MRVAAIASLLLMAAAVIAAVIVGVQRFLYPVHPSVLEGGHDLVGRVQVPALIGVAHERDVSTDLASYRPHPPRVLTPVRMPHLHLHPPPSLVD